jgi:hypothetical protein
MNILNSVKEVMSFIEDGDSMWVTLITACSNEEIYSNWYFHMPYEFKEPDVTSIRIESTDHVILYIL